MICPEPAPKGWPDLRDFWNMPGKVHRPCPGGWEKKRRETGYWPVRLQGSLKNGDIKPAAVWAVPPTRLMSPCFRIRNRIPISWEFSWMGKTTGKPKQPETDIFCSPEYWKDWDGILSAYGPWNGWKLRKRNGIVSAAVWRNSIWESKRIISKKNQA